MRRRNFFKAIAAVTAGGVAAACGKGEDEPVRVVEVWGDGYPTATAAYWRWYDEDGFPHTDRLGDFVTVKDVNSLDYITMPSWVNQPYWLHIPPRAGDWIPYHVPRHVDHP